MHDKIKKLLAMSHHPNSDPNEAANAAAMAAMLAARHNIDMDALRDTPPKEFMQDTMEWEYPARDDQALIFLTNAVGLMYGCQPYVIAGKSSRRVGFVGQKHNVELSKSWATYLWDSCRRANTEHARSMNYGSSAAREKARSAFRYGFCTTVSKRLREAMTTMTTQGVSETGTALVVTAWFEQERQEVLHFMSNRLNFGRTFTGRGVRGGQIALSAGQSAGSRVSLNKQLAR